VWLQNVYGFVTVPQKYNEFLEKKSVLLKNGVKMA